MNLVFMNSLEKKGEENRVITAQVSIGEQHGKWHVLWTEPNPKGNHEQQSWYEGDRWDEMLAVFRERITEQCNAGFQPVVAEWSQRNELPERWGLTQILHYYSEINVHQELFDRLREWRRKHASAMKMAPFMVASNRELMMISVFLPQTEAELLCIPGFGETKLRSYGKDILAHTESYTRSTSFPLGWVTEAIDFEDFKHWIRQQKENKVKAEAERRENKRLLLKHISSGTSLTLIQQELHFSRRDICRWLEELDQEGYAIESWIETELKTIPLEKRELALKEFKAQGDRFLRPIAEKVYGKEELKLQKTDEMYGWLRMLRLCLRRQTNTAGQTAVG